MHEMPQISKVDGRNIGADFPLKNPWTELMYRYATYVSDLQWDLSEDWLRR